MKWSVVESLPVVETLKYGGLYNLHNNEVYVENVSEETFKDYMANPQNYPDNIFSAYASDDTHGYALGYIYTKSKNEFGYYFFGNIGYRHVAKSGFMFRVGVTLPTIPDNQVSILDCGGKGDGLTLN